MAEYKITDGQLRKVGPKRLGIEWVSYRTDVMHPDCPEQQMLECRRAFYGGAKALLFLMLKALDPGKEPTGDDLKMMDEIQKELDDFQLDVIRGKA